MTELDRRENAKTADRDFKMAERSDKMEKWVIVLIGLELLIAVVTLVYGIVEGNKQQTVLGHMDVSTASTASVLKSQGQILETMNTNTANTVTAMEKLQQSQDNSLSAQKSTVKSVGKMNAVLQKQLDMAFEVSVGVLSDDTEKRINIHNLTKTAIYLWGSKLDGATPSKFLDERFVAPGEWYSFFGEVQYEQAAGMTPKGTERKVPLEFFIRSADGKPYIAHCYVVEKWESDTMRFLITVTSVKQEPWPSDAK